MTEPAPRFSLKDKFSSSHIERYALFLLSMLLFGLAGGLFRGVQDNYLAWIGIGKAGRGVVEFFRELPGLLLFLLLAPFYRMAERNLIRIALSISVLGVLGIIFLGSSAVPTVLFLTIWSTGEHLIMPVRRSYAIHSADPGKEGRALGFLKGVENAGKVLGLAMVSLVFLLPKVLQDRDNGGRLGFVIILSITALIVFFAVIASMGMSRSSGSLERKRLYIRRKFTRYYGLEMFYGARKQVSFTFGPYLLILRYGAQTEYLATLLGISALINIFFNPVIGRIIDRWGYRTVMIGDTVILFFVCLLYGFAHHIFSEGTALTVVSVVFVLDRMISNASMASSIYVNHISEGHEEVAATLSTGISINHIISVSIALVGGLIWQTLGVELLFVLAAMMAVGNTLFAVSIPRVSSSV
ncbi:MAG: MFS transporter [Spirochaetes bacterium]|nr:MAG: MFS transporter [Spirochaetota bacterium]